MTKFQVGDKVRVIEKNEPYTGKETEISKVIPNHGYPYLKDAYEVETVIGRFYDEHLEAITSEPLYKVGDKVRVVNINGDASHYRSGGIDTLVNTNKDGYPYIGENYAYFEDELELFIEPTPLEQAHATLEAATKARDEATLDYWRAVIAVQALENGESE